MGKNPIRNRGAIRGADPHRAHMATSEAAMGKIGMAVKAGQAIPTNGREVRRQRTSDPSEVIAGMLLPSGGPKGFGLAFLIDLCDLLSAGAHGAAVQPLDGDPSSPDDSSHCSWRSMSRILAIRRWRGRTPLAPPGHPFRERQRACRNSSPRRTGIASAPMPQVRSTGVGSGRDATRMARECGFSATPL